MQLVTASVDGTISTWDVSQGAKLLDLKSAHLHAALTCVAASPDGRRIATGASDGTVFVWSLLSGHLLLTLKCPEGKEVAGLIYDEVGHILLSSSHPIKTTITVSGWNRRLAVFDISADIDLGHIPINVTDGRCLLD